MFSPRPRAQQIERDAMIGARDSKTRFRPMTGRPDPTRRRILVSTSSLVLFLLSAYLWLWLFLEASTMLKCLE